MTSKKKDPGEDKKDTQKKATDSDAAANENQPVKTDKADDAPPAKTGAELVNDSRLLSHSAKSIVAALAKMEKEKQAAKTQNDFIDGLLKSKSTYDKSTNAAISLITPAQRKVLVLTKKANTAFMVATTAQEELEKEKLANVVKQDAKVLDNQILSDKTSSSYFLKKNKGHIRKKVVKILENYHNAEPSAFRALKILSTSRGKNRKKNFETQILALVKTGGDKLYKQFTGTLSFKNEMIDFVREKIVDL
jgi:hypothetical protein